MTARQHDRQHARLAIEYDGSDFHGWSRQRDLPTIEQAIFDSAAKIRLEIDALACGGRTDTGVHASGQVASIAYRGTVPPENLALALNQHLPAKISVLRSVVADPEFDARVDALARVYKYRVLPGPVRSPLRAGYCLHHPRPLNLAAMQQAAELVRGQHDFTAFTPSRTEHSFFRRTVLESRWDEVGDEYVYTIRANAFLRHMVRVITGCMFAIGRGEWELSQLERLLSGAVRSEAHKTAPPHGLCLVAVEYEPAGDVLGRP